MENNNKSMTPVEWLAEQFNAPAYLPHIRQALQMEAEKQQKYNKMLEMLKVCQQAATSKIIYDELEKLIKEAQEL